ncbi:TPA: hypothetical protein ACX6S1_001199 [Photobacterium damselae]
MYKTLLGIATENQLIRADMKWDTTKSHDIEILWLVEKSPDDNVVARYVIKVTKELNFPDRRNISYQKYTPDSLSLVSSGELIA